MKIHTFVRDTKLMEQNEREAVVKRERFIKQQQRSIELPATEEHQEVEAPQKARKKKNKEAV